jgi:Hint module
LYPESYASVLGPISHIMKICMSLLLVLVLLGPSVTFAAGGQKDPVCASEQRKFCENWCENVSCYLTVDPDDCYSGCVPCCIGADFDLIDNLVSSARTSIDFDILRLNPQCKKYSTYWIGIFPPAEAFLLLGYPGDSKVDICNLECNSLCGDQDKCVETCTPCCKAKLLAQCYDDESQRVPQCDKLKEDFPDAYYSLCFPADATVELEIGSTARMDELKIGDRVKVMYKDKTLGFEDIYQFGHKESSQLGLSYLKLFVESKDSQDMHELILSETHYLTVPNEEGKPSLITAESIQIGSKVWVADKGAAKVVEGVLTDKYAVAAYGAYTPYTLNGNIVVNGVIASSHNDWSYAEKLVPQAIKPSLPMIYDMLLAFHRVGYTLMGANLWNDINSAIDLSAPKFRRAFGSAAAITAMSIHMYLGTDSVATVMSEPSKAGL